MPINLQIISDIHLEFYNEVPDFTQFIKPKAKNIALLGDISALGHGSEYFEFYIYKELLNYCSGNFEHVFVITGNHEYWASGGGEDTEILTHQEVDLLIKNTADEYENVHFLQRNSFVIDNVRFVGCTLWSKPPEEFMEKVQYCMSDYRVIYKDAAEDNMIENLTIHDTVKIFEEDVAFIENEIKVATNLKQVCVILTHHAPSTSCFYYGNSNLESAMAMLLPKAKIPLLHGCCTNLNHLLSHSDTKLHQSLFAWCYGHIHISKNENIGKTKVVSNQVGYKSMKKGKESKFDHNPEFYIEIPNKINAENNCTIS